ncbi:hypothetical protein L1278_002354 [Pontibacter sp. HSC-36F09]|nr:hypothetical protein [Pontibacter sp. HSC-36F09]
MLALAGQALLFPLMKRKRAPTPHTKSSFLHRANVIFYVVDVQVSLPISASVLCYITYIYEMEVAEIPRLGVGALYKDKDMLGVVGPSMS